MKDTSKQALRDLRLAIKSTPKPVAVPVQVDAQQLWKRATEGAIPLKASPRHTHPPQSKRRVQQSLELEDMRIHDNMSDFWPWHGDEGEMMHAKPGQKLDTLKRLKKGYWPPEAHLDLHGLESDRARGAVGQFVHDMSAQRRRCVTIVHGKGLSSADGIPVLKAKLRNWLVQRDEVLAFAEAPQQTGGSGAVLVLLRSPKGGQG